MVMIRSLSFKLNQNPISSISQFSTLVEVQTLIFTKEAFNSLLKSHSSHPNALKQVHALILTSGLSIKNGLLTELLTNFLVLGNLGYARKLFDEMHKPRCYLWNTLIKGYVKNQMHFKGACVYKKMHLLDVRPDSFTYPFVLKACAEMNDDTWFGLSVQVHVLKYGLDVIPMVRTELVAMYVKFGDIETADYLFESMSDKDLVAWNSLITAYVQNGNAVKAIQLFHKMKTSGIMPDSITIVSAISACSHLGWLETGKNIHNFARKEENIDKNNIILKNALLDMYMKCGSIGTALDLFDSMPDKNVVSYSTMILGLAMNGDSEKALALFCKMKDESVTPNDVTLLGVLSACNHAGLVQEGRNYFKNITESNLKPTKEHYACMVDLLGRSGQIQEAYNFIKNMPIDPDPAIWGALLGACTVHKNIELGQIAADNLFALAPDIGSYHILLSNMYAAAGRWHYVEKVRAKMRKKGVKKVVGYSQGQS